MPLEPIRTRPKLEASPILYPCAHTPLTDGRILTRVGTRHQAAARPVARGHYILHSPRDTLADDPSHNRQRDFKLLLTYEITTPAHEDFGQVQKELGLAEKDAVALQVKDPEVQSNNNPRAAGIPREKRAQVSSIPVSPPPSHSAPSTNIRRFTLKITV